MATNGNYKSLKKVALIVTIIVAVISITINISSYVKAGNNELYNSKYFDKVKGEVLESKVTELEYDIKTHFAEQNKAHASIADAIKRLEISNAKILLLLDR